ncbi:hypothetical protein [Halocynthiibacter sp.]|uniref:hypothetical protein n=1 Tax=Halocynthiibacter sp. TaxID=1979210 RepID=UPI003C3483F6
MLFRGLISAIGFIVAVPAAAEVSLSQFLGPHGCAIGPSTEAAALGAGYSQAGIDDLKIVPEGIVSGQWVFLPEPICQIELPQVVSEISMDDPEVLAATSAPDAYAQYGDPGCFLDGEKLRNFLILGRGWDREQMFREYVRFLAAGLMSGELRFYSDAPLRTPPGFQMLSGACAEVTGTDAMAENHNLLTDLFVPFLQAAGKSEEAANCAEGDVFGTQSWEVIEQLSAGRNTNAHLAFEMQLITIGAGWYDGMSSAARGTPRPPLCGVYQE